MKRIFILLSLSFFLSNNSYSQIWDTTITAGSVTNDAGNKVKFDSDGNMVVNGFCSGNTNFGPSMLNYTGGFVAKYDNIGNLLWVIKAGDNLSLTAVNKQASGSIELDANNNIYITGNFTDTAHIGTANLPGNATNKNIFLAKVSPSGNVLWTKYITNNSVSTGIALDADNNIAICGYTEGVSVFDGNTITPFGGNPRDAVFAKYDSVGTFQWVRQAGGPGTFGDKAFAIAFDASKNILVSGFIRSHSTFGSLSLLSTAPSFSYFNGFLTKYSSTGTAIWVNYCGYTPMSLVTNSNNDVFIGGYTGPDNGFDSIINIPSNGKMFVAKSDSNGVYEWASSVGGPGTSGTCDIVIDANNNSYITGHFIDSINFGNHYLIGNPSGIWYEHLFIAKYNANGVDQWVKQAGGGVNSHTYGFGIDIIDTCSMAVCGSFATPPMVGFGADSLNSVGGYDFFVAKFSDNCSQCLNSSSSQTVSACGNYQSPGGQWYYSSQTIMDTIPNIAGCDSIIQINLTIDTVDISVTQTLNDLTANAIGATYQWVDCNNSFTILSGETNQIMPYSVPGDFAVIVSENGCTDTSACYVVVVTGIEQNVSSNEIQLYPNPNNGIFKINTGNVKERIIFLYNSLGEQVFQTNQFLQEINISNQPKGVYHLRIITSDKIYTRKIIIQ